MHRSVPLAQRDYQLSLGQPDYQYQLLKLLDILNKIPQDTLTSQDMYVHVYVQMGTHYQDMCACACCDTGVHVCPYIYMALEAQLRPPF